MSEVHKFTQYNPFDAILDVIYGICDRYKGVKDVSDELYGYCMILSDLKEKYVLLPTQKELLNQTLYFLRSDNNDDLTYIRNSMEYVIFLDKNNTLDFSGVWV